MKNIDPKKIDRELEKMNNLNEKERKEFEKLSKLIKGEKKPKVGDKYTIPAEDKSYKFIIMGIDQNPNEDCHYHFVDLISYDNILNNVPFSKNSNMDDYLNDIQSPEFLPLRFNNSYLKIRLNEIYDSLTSFIKPYIMNKESVEIKTINNITGKIKYKRINIGKAWIPSVAEIIGKVYSSMNCSYKEEQYEYFKFIDNLNRGSKWWTRTTSVGEDSFVYSIVDIEEFEFYQETDSTTIDLSFYGNASPLCLRLMIKGDK